MCSRKNDYVITKQEVHGYANEWLCNSLKLEYQGRKCTALIVSSSNAVSASLSFLVLAY